MTQVFMLNMGYDVPVKLFSFELLLLALFLLAPDFLRLIAFFFLNRTVDSSTPPALFRSQHANRIAVALQVTLGILLLGTNVFGGWRGWRNYGGGRAKSPFYGLWNVEQLSIDGRVSPPLLTDSERWRRAIFDFPGRMTFERMDDSLDGYGASFDPHAKTLVLSRGSSKSTFKFRPTGESHLTLDGSMDGRQVHVELQLVDQNKFMLLHRGFNWIQEYPVNR